jgi:hypothetical protein
MYCATKDHFFRNKGGTPTSHEFTITTLHSDVVGAYNAVGASYVPEHHSDDYGKALPCLRKMHESDGAMRALYDQLMGVVVIASQPSKAN